MGDYTEDAVERPNGRRFLAVVYLPLLVGSVWLLVARALGARIGAPLLVAAAAWCGVAVLTAAGCAMHAALRRRLVWTAALLVAWPATVPVYLWRLEPSAEPEV